MKKLVLLVSVFLLIAGMVAADVTFAPVVTGSASVTWGMDLKVADAEMNSGFDTASSTSLDLGVVVDPVDAKGGEGIYGEVTISGLKVTAKSGADVEVAAPAIAAKLWFSEAFYGFIDTDGIVNNYAEPLGELVVVDEEKQKGTWFDSGEDFNNAKVVAEYGNAGYGFTLMAGDLTATLSLVSNDLWGTDGDDDENFLFATYDANSSDGLDAIELTALQNAVDALSTGDFTYEPNILVINGDMAAGGEAYPQVNDDGEIEFIEYDDGDFSEYTYDVDVDTSTANSALYTVGIDVAYTLTDVGVFKAYAAPTHTSHTKQFTGVNFGAMAAIALADFDMVGLTVGADMVLDNSDGVADAEKFDYELNVTVPVKVGDMLTMNFKAAATDASAADDNTPLDLYADATLMAAGATVKGAYMVSNFMEADAQSASYEVSASYPVAVAEGTVTPMINWEHDMNTVNSGIGANEGVLTVSAAAAVVENTTFTLKYVSGDMFVAAGEKVDPGMITFTTAFAY